ncbi:endonuclease V [Cellulosimicrobium sp. Marseille-Q4280]|uniref:endonuclease V n=1 Tax=Cellulosimicrobium sp. Marseille-Q4280 TaxID=2937992 RepID=UPI00203FB007|nr:endonuclease V [Cellulosimicrobium sp. Marseille-Q4280]
MATAPARLGDPLGGLGRSAAVDVHYPHEGGAHAAVVVAADPSFLSVIDTRTISVPTVEPYVPGRFFERELPPLIAVLAEVATIDLLIVDGYVTLDPQGTPGLGAHVAQSGVARAIVGVAKKRFRPATHAVSILRGTSGRPLHVTATGIDLTAAARLVVDLPGDGRIPSPLRLVDRLARSGPASVAAQAPH